MQQVRRGRLQFLAVVVTLVAVTFSCSSDDDDPRSLDQPSSTSDTQPVGEARTAPSSVRIGDQFVITPDAVIQPICLNAAVVLQESTSGQRVGILMPDGAWQGYDTGPDPTVAACHPAASADAETYEVPPEMAGGDYVVCLTWEQDEAGCGPLTVEG